MWQIWTQDWSFVVLICSVNQATQVDLVPKSEQDDLVDSVKVDFIFTQYLLL